MRDLKNLNLKSSSRNSQVCRSRHGSAGASATKVHESLDQMPREFASSLPPLPQQRPLGLFETLTEVGLRRSLGVRGLICILQSGQLEMKLNWVRLYVHLWLRVSVVWCIIAFVLAPIVSLSHCPSCVKRCKKQCQPSTSLLTSYYFAVLDRPHIWCLHTWSRTCPISQTTSFGA